MKTRVLTAVVALVSFLAAAQQKPEPPPPLNERQIVKVRELVQTSQEEIKNLNAQLNERQQRLALVYARYQLDQEACKQLQDEIIELQRKLLASHHRMQIELRTIVGKERFDHLRRRLEHAASTADEATPDGERRRK